MTPAPPSASEVLRNIAQVLQSASDVSPGALEIRLPKSWVQNSVLALIIAAQHLERSEPPPSLAALAIPALLGALLGAAAGFTMCFLWVI
jgi:hypothetical protein